MSNKTKWVRYLRPMIAETARQTVKKKSASKSTGRYNSGKQIYQFKISFVNLIKDSLLILIGIISAGFGLAGFLIPNSFIDGGVTGISLLATALTNYPLQILIVVINIPFIILGLRQMGKPFAIKSIIAIIALAVAITFIQYPSITSDKLLVAVFGGFFIGLGIGFTIRGGAVLDGTEVLAIYLSKRSGLSIGDIILTFNVVIFSFAAYILSVEIALYSILTYLAASKTVDFVIEGLEEYTGVTIVSNHSEEIRLMVLEKMGRGVTIYNGKSGNGRNGDNPHHVEIVYTVITRLEIAKLENEVDAIDPNAFIVMSSVKDTKGGMIKKRPLTLKSQ